MTKLFVTVCRDCPGSDDHNAHRFDSVLDRDFWKARHTKKFGHSNFHDVDQIGAP